MIETYKFLANFAQTWGLLYFVSVFAIAVAWVLWPANRQRFEDAARMPLRED
jgi:cytochrome c oxidase cbb3-type subunit IV